VRSNHFVFLFSFFYLLWIVGRAFDLSQPEIVSNSLIIINGTVYMTLCTFLEWIRGQIRQYFLSCIAIIADTFRQWFLLCGVD
jgi:hypothetical protein